MPVLRSIIDFLKIRIAEKEEKQDKYDPANV
jgi:hypothetical protein